MSIVYTPGCFDLLHVGHLNFLERARGFGDTLIVGVASDLVVIEDKMEAPVIHLEDRIKMLRALKYVTTAIGYYTLSFLEHLKMFRPDVLVVGDQWGEELRHKQAEEWVATYKRKIIKLSRYNGESTTSIRDRIRRSS